MLILAIIWILPCGLFAVIAWLLTYSITSIVKPTDIEAMLWKAFLPDLGISTRVGIHYWIPIFIYELYIIPELYHIPCTFNCTDAVAIYQLFSLTLFLLNFTTFLEISAFYLFYFSFNESRNGSSSILACQLRLF